MSDSPKIKDLYALLGVPRDADVDQIRKAFRAKAKEFHPDSNKEEGAENKFRDCEFAYATLTDETKRARYDTLFAPPINPEGSQFNDKPRTTRFRQENTAWPTPEQSQEMRDIFGDDWYTMYETGTRDVLPIHQESSHKAEDIMASLNNDTARIMQEINMGTANMMRKI